MDLDSVVCPTALTLGTLAQKSELKTLSQALKLAKGAISNIYPDSRYAFAMAYVHGSTYQEKDLLFIDC